MGIENFNHGEFCRKRNQETITLPYSLGLQASNSLLRQMESPHEHTMILEQNISNGYVKSWENERLEGLKKLVPSIMPDDEAGFKTTFIEKIKRGIEAAAEIKLSNDFKNPRSDQKTLENAQNSAKAFIKSVARELCQHVSGLEQGFRDANVIIEKGK
jgi:hypothetical protein